MFSDSNDPYAQLRPSEQQRLDEANQLYEDGKAGQAAPLFARIAEVLTANRQAQRAANLHAQAAQAYAESNNESAALTQSRSALNIFLKLNVEKRTQYFYTSIRKELTKRGMNQAAETLAKEFAARVSRQRPQRCPLLLDSRPTVRSVERLSVSVMPMSLISTRLNVPIAVLPSGRPLAASRKRCCKDEHTSWLHHNKRLTSSSY